VETAATVLAEVVTAAGAVIAPRAKVATAARVVTAPRAKVATVEMEVMAHRAAARVAKGAKGPPAMGVVEVTDQEDNDERSKS